MIVIILVIIRSMSKNVMNKWKNGVYAKDASLYACSEEGSDVNCALTVSRGGVNIQEREMLSGKSGIS